MNDNEIEEASKLAHEMCHLLLAAFQGKSMEYIFKVGSHSLSLLIGGFIDALFDNSHTEAKIHFIEHLTQLTKIILIAKDKARESEKKGKH
jgi:hypothetical protein